MRQSQEAERARLEADIVKKEKEIQNQKNAKNRGLNALNKEKQL
jgi:hypothetical protein